MNIRARTRYSMKEVNLVHKKGLKLGFFTYRETIFGRASYFRVAFTRRKKAK